MLTKQIVDRLHHVLLAWPGPTSRAGRPRCRVAQCRRAPRHARRRRATGPRESRAEASAQGGQRAQAGSHVDTPAGHVPLGRGASERPHHRPDRCRQDVSRLHPRTAGLPPGHRVIYRRTPRLCPELALAHGDGTYPTVLARFARVDVLFLNDWRLVGLKDAQWQDGHRSTVIMSQLPIDSWREHLGDPTLADVILDRVVHRAHRVALTRPCALGSCRIVHHTRRGSTSF